MCDCQQLKERQKKDVVCVEMSRPYIISQGGIKTHVAFCFFCFFCVHNIVEEKRVGFQTLSEREHRRGGRCSHDENYCVGLPTVQIDAKEMWIKTTQINRDGVLYPKPLIWITYCIYICIHKCGSLIIRVLIQRSFYRVSLYVHDPNFLSQSFPMNSQSNDEVKQVTANNVN